MPIVIWPPKITQLDFRATQPERQRVLPAITRWLPLRRRSPLQDSEAVVRFGAEFGELSQDRLDVDFVLEVTS